MITEGIGLLFGSGEDLYGTKPEIPDYPTLDAAVDKALALNKTHIKDYQEIGASQNTFNQEELRRLLKYTIPGLDDLNKQVTDSITGMIRGEIPKDVQSLIERKNAERAVSGGFSGSGMHHNLSARDLGLTSLQLTQTGLSSAERWIASAKQNQTAPLYDVSNMFVSPAQAFSAAEGKFQRDVLAANVKAAPDPVARGQFDSEMAFIGMVLSAYGGGAGYTGQYKPQQQGMSGGGGGGGYGFGGGGGNSNYVPSSSSYGPAYSNAAGQPTATPQGSSDYSFSLF